MLRALLLDVKRIPDGSAVTLWDARLDPPQLPGVEVVTVADRRSEEAQFRRLVRECDATLIIAPEFDGMLARRRRWVDELGGLAVGSTVEAINFCADKLSLSRVLTEQGILTPQTVVLDAERRESPLAFPLVVKPRDGAGSQHTFLVRDARELRDLPLSRDGWPREFVCQPFVAGRALSAAAIVERTSRLVRVFPVGLQRLSNEGRFQYLGGEIPADRKGAGGEDRATAGLQNAAEQLVRKVAGSIRGLAGYVGFDFVLPEGRMEPVLIEVNPRLTTAYVGYRQIADENLAERMIFPERRPGEIRWRNKQVVFKPDGSICDEAAS